MAKTLSGAAWVSRFPTSTSTDDLAQPFRAHAKKFVAALEAAGASVTVNATVRPKQRAFLMHWSYRVGRMGFDPEQVPSMAGVDIDWVDRDSNQKKNAAASIAAARAMVAGYEIAYPPALVSRHTEGKAIDMEISWTSAELAIKDGAGKVVTIKSGAKDGSNSHLHAVGRSYGVVKLASDPPHWSSDGH